MSMMDTASPAPGPASAESLGILLDYAIAEGATLRLPTFVLLLRMAALELAQHNENKGAGLNKPRVYEPTE